MSDGIKAIINRALDTQEVLLQSAIDRSKGDDTPIFGQDGQLDSMALVSLVVEIEEIIETELSVRLILASERAMSVHRSPFSTIGSLAKYVSGLMAETSDA